MSRVVVLNHVTFMASCRRQAVPTRTLGTASNTVTGPRRTAMTCRQAMVARMMQSRSAVSRIGGRCRS